MNPLCGIQEPKLAADPNRIRPPYSAKHCLDGAEHQYKGKIWIAVQGRDRVFWQEKKIGQPFNPAPTASAAGAPPVGAPPVGATYGVTIEDFVSDGSSASSADLYNSIPTSSGASIDSISIVSEGGTKTHICPDGWARHRKTGRCRKKSCGEGRVRERKSGKCKKKLGPCKPGFVRSRKKPRHCKLSPCRSGQIRDKVTKQCRKSLRPRKSPARKSRSRLQRKYQGHCKYGRYKSGYCKPKSAKKSSRRRSAKKSRSRRRKSCKPSQFRSPSTGRCRRRSCKKGKLRDQKSKRCRKSRKKSKRRRSRSRR